ncbi:nucleotidyltransferase family protein [Phyllobacterium myrsinacearum]|uniref:Mannose-1-phosphate guanylyltransferase n=1 Tax=Phyllobacterium myrsinacearum TaxID=28101 RepID=A0A2S9JJ15_9HYPH|nr:nucleotidyltransferase family protein [Phyllobacterium myrsinacearum]PRD53101.1 mannose-1-phosphate guanylyltransferase [Phyllobacterium myrsinacearum]PWV94052.1 MurNAc alpha-1-phosphate uridylyltransferase [Phyllobacterium myrsinacearum]RZV07509.1 MurNAc alpha-1-phosphate uridylyltransferase [Phyllobacterium myrsinacearum]
MTIPGTAIVLAAGLGKRLRPITDTIPKPLVKVAGKSLIDWSFDALNAAGVARAVVNVHYLADQMEQHLASRRSPVIAISDERAELLDSAGGIVKALPLIGRDAFYILNADTFWIDGPRPNLVRLAEAWDASKMDILVMVARMDQATGYEGRGDFTLDAEGRLQRFHEGDASPYIYAGAAITHPRLFDGKPVARASLNRYFDEAIGAGRLFGMPMQGHWLTVGTPEAIGEAEAVIARLGQETHG